MQSKQGGMPWSHLKLQVPEKSPNNASGNHEADGLNRVEKSRENILMRTILHEVPLVTTVVL